MAVGGINQGYNKYTLTEAEAGSAQSEAVDAIFKEYYLPAVRDLLNNKKVMSRYVRQNTEDVTGKYAMISLNTSRNQGIGHIYEQGKLPDPGKQGYITANYRLRQYYGRILFSGLANSSSRNDRGAFIRVMDGEIKGLARDMQVDLNRIIFGDGSGRLARVSANDLGSPSTYTLELPGGFTQNLGVGTQYIEDGMRVAVVRTDGVSPEAANAWATITSNKAYYVVNTNYAAGTVQFSLEPGGTAATLAPVLAPASNQNWYLFRASEVSSSLMQQDTAIMSEPFGLAAVVDEANPFGGFSGGENFLGGIDADDQPLWRAPIVDNGGTPVPYNIGVLDQAQDALDQAGDGTVQLWVMTHGLRRQHVQQLTSNKRFVGTMELDGGYTAITHNERPIVVDKDMTRGRVYGLDLDTLMWFMGNDFAWADADGSILQRLMDYDAYQAMMYRYHQFGTDARNRNVGVFDLIDS